MGKAFIFNEHLGDDDRAVIEAAIRAAEYDPVYGVPADVSSLDPERDLGVVALPVAAEEFSVINARTQMFAGAGVRVVGIWLHDEDGDATGIPEGIGKYGTSVDVGSPELASVLHGEVDVWEGPLGSGRPMPTTKRNKC